MLCFFFFFSGGRGVNCIQKIWSLCSFHFCCSRLFCVFWLVGGFHSHANVLHLCIGSQTNIKTFIRKLPPSFVGGRVSPRAKTLPFMEFGKHNEHESSDDIHHLPHVGNSTSQVSFLEGNWQMSRIPMGKWYKNMTDVISPLNLQRRRTSTGSVELSSQFFVRRCSHRWFVLSPQDHGGGIPFPTGHLECQDHLMLRDHHVTTPPQFFVLQALRW